MIITYTEGVLVALVIQYAIRNAPYCHLCSAPLYKIFPHYLTNCTIFEKKYVTEHKMYDLIFWTAFV